MVAGRVVGDGFKTGRTCSTANSIRKTFFSCPPELFWRARCFFGLRRSRSQFGDSNFEDSLGVFAQQTRQGDGLFFRSNAWLDEVLANAGQRRYMLNFGRPNSSLYMSL